MSSTKGSKHNRIFETLGEELDALDIRKSNLLLYCMVDRAYERWGEVFAKYAEIAPMEERLAEASRAAGLYQRMLIHQTSAASCWAHAGNQFRAIQIADEMLADPDLPDAHRAHITELRTRWQTERLTFLRPLFTDEPGDDTIAVTK